MSSIFLSLAKQVKNQKDRYIIPSNLRKGITAFGVTGTLEPSKTEQEKTVNPSTSSVEVLPDTNFVLSKVTVNPVDNTIDSNIISENIKQGVSILGISGTYDGGVADALSDSY